MKLQFGTKAQNLVNLYGLLQSARVLPSVVLKVSQDWQKRLQDITALGEEVIIRSSSNAEDTQNCSNAGAFLSLPHINTGDTAQLQEAISRVASSMTNEESGDGGEILIQPMLSNICSCGVAFSVDKENLSPYFCIEYDRSGSTSSITAGENTESVSSFIFRDYEFTSVNHLSQIIQMIRELEEIYEYSFLDVEFAFALNEEGVENLYCLQVRPLVIANKMDLFHQISKNDLDRLSKRINMLSKINHGVLGEKKIFGVMPDWNPAEIIGLRPKRLALSLYKEIITDNIWAYQRKNYGYRDLHSHQLMHSFFGIPYIDVQLSFNSFIPAKINDTLASKLANYYLLLLEKSPYLHDKVEFEIVFSCFDFSSEYKLEGLLEQGFNHQEISTLKNALLDLTNNIISSTSGLYLEDMKKIEILQKRYCKLIETDMSKLDLLYWLIEDCKRFGTLPFAGIARAAFVAMQILNSMVVEGLICSEQKKQFLESLNTISKQLSYDRARLSKEEFLQKYGHLRAGTYDILSPRYDEDFEKYFGDFEVEAPNSKMGGIIFEEGQIKKIDLALEKNGLRITANDLFVFMRTAIEGRESSKFEFTKMLSKAIEIIGEIGGYYQIPLGKMAHLDIKEILSLHSTLYKENPRERFLHQIKSNEQDYLATCAIKLPPLILRGDDVFCFSTSVVLPNFVTFETIVADVAFDRELQGKIVLIDAADPGYDYLFTKGIAGLVTCYGGANSHMAIRCSELGLPAVIGVGEEKFAIYKKAKRLHIDCLNQKIFPIF
ncbi:hypothetical protein CQA62_05930 [Helicobacter cholecystus]|uniref:PEP-utilising enzyme mobile domain-containing protein n=1 Tax=Helicobacter cholecystus TaxID=45498 RepID=A0A3D8IUF4_9HELI|nr:PEP-utilizing enzyme [Helicobacter cholecystus]RDU68640.1 hypothetical protein CQA62_05930 [Helicobacter cholecystus]VEJ24432.1 phosphoenolpyruvate synthase [Helicobacter cholecystus]